jgi:hypothetical protein
MLVKRDDHFVLACNPMKGTVPSDACLIKWLGAQILSMRVSIDRLITGLSDPAGPRLRRKTEELIDRQLKDMRADDSWKPPSDDNPTV